MKLTYFVKRMIRRQIPAPIFNRILAYSHRTAKGERRPDKAFQSFLGRLRHLSIELAGKHVLEFGSGRYARLAVRLLNADASRVTLADFYAKPLNNPQHRKILDEDCTKLGLDTEKTLASINLVTGDFLDTSPLDSEVMADLIISDSAMEHVQDPQAIFEKCWEWLRPGGFVSHRIDLRDHLFDTPFEMLTYSDQTWDRWLNPKSGFHLNRWRLQDYLQAMREANFTEINYHSLQKDEAELMEIWPRLYKHFREMDPDLLSITVVHLYAQKPFR